MPEPKNLLLIMRHASSNLPHYQGRDIDRPLDYLGESQVFSIAKQLNDLGVVIDRACVSSAFRTRETFALLTKKLKIKSVTFEARLYQALLPEVLEVIEEQSENSKNLLILGHNPVLSELNYCLSKEAYEFRPANVALLRAKGSSISLSLAKNYGFSLERILSPEHGAQI